MSGKQWYITVGYPGGEYAATDPQALAKTDTEEINSGSMCADWFIRLCPPDLADWLDTPMHEYVPLKQGASRLKVPGGWLYCNYEAYRAGEMHSTGSVSVAGASGITVWEANNE